MKFHFFFDVGIAPMPWRTQGIPRSAVASAAKLPRFAADHVHGPGGSEFDEIGSHRPGGVPAKNFRQQILLRFATGTVLRVLGERGADVGFEPITTGGDDIQSGRFQLRPKQP